MTILDLSQYDLPTFDAECMKRQGVTGAILGVFSRGNPPHDMANAAEKLIAAGIQVLGFYGVVYFGHFYGRSRDTEWAITLAKQFGVKRVWLDCEIDAYQVGWPVSAPSPAERVIELATLVNKVKAAGLEPGIYTGAWWWRPNMGNSTLFSRMGVPLWHAQYGPQGSPAPPVRVVNYGGWTDVAIHQYTSTVPVCGRGRDHNYYFLKEEDDGMDEATVRAIAREEINKSETAYLVRNLANLAINGGDGAYTDSEGNELPLVRDEALLERVANLEQSGGGQGISPGDTVAFEYKGKIE